MAEREENFADIIDYDKVDGIIEEHYAKFNPHEIDTERTVNNVNQLFLFSGGSAATVGALVKDERSNRGFADTAFKVDSEIAIEWDIIRYLAHDAKLTKHPEKLRPIDIIRGNSVVARLWHAEDISQQTPPYRTTQEHLLSIPIFGDIRIPKGYIFSDKKGVGFYSGEPHEQAFQALLRYVGQKVFEVAEEKGLKTTLVIDDHFEDLATAKHIIASAKSYAAETMFIQSFVKPEVAIERAAQRFRNEGGGENISYRINRYTQMRTHLHQPRNWMALREIVDGAILTHRNIEGQSPVIIQRCFKDDEGKIHIRTGTNKRGWFNSFLKIDKLPKDPEKALYELGFAPSTSKFASFSALSNGGGSTAVARLRAQQEKLDGWFVEEGNAR